jgi:hypothetical protein
MIKDIYFFDMKRRGFNYSYSLRPCVRITKITNNLNSLYNLEKTIGSKKCVQTESEVDNII